MTTFSSVNGWTITGDVVEYINIEGGLRIVTLTTANGVRVPVLLDENLTVTVA